VTPARAKKLMRRKQIANTLQNGKVSALEVIS
jgi:hypothetical protein